MNSKQKRYLKLNLMSLFFAGMSFISITLAWFAYSGLVTTRTEIDVKAWYIQFDKQGTPVSNNIVIPLSEIYPGMETISETINIKNMGDSDAALSYEITSARILDKYIQSNGEKGYVEDQLSHQYPFHINISLSDAYANANDGTGEFVISVSWPLDSGDDKNDNDWGAQAHLYQQNNPNKPAIEIEINLKASQYLGDISSSDTDYKLGTIVLYDPEENIKCTELGNGCIQTYVIDKDNLIGDTEVTLIPALDTITDEAVGTEYETKIKEYFAKYKSASPLKVEDILPIVSKDVLNTIIISPSFSNEIVGTLDYKNQVDTYDNRLEANIAKTISRNGTYRFTTLNFMYFSTNKCIWLNTNYGDNGLFALNKIDDTYSKIYNENSTQKCLVVPTFKLSKSN